MRLREAVFGTPPVSIDRRTPSRASLSVVWKVIRLANMFALSDSKNWILSWAGGQARFARQAPSCVRMPCKQKSLHFRWHRQSRF